MSLMQMSSTSTPSNQCVQKNPKYELVAFSSESSQTNEDIVVICNGGPLKLFTTDYLLSYKWNMAVGRRMFHLQQIISLVALTISTPPIWHSKSQVDLDAFGFGSWGGNIISTIYVPSAVIEQNDEATKIICLSSGFSSCYRSTEVCKYAAPHRMKGAT